MSGPFYGFEHACKCGAGASAPDGPYGSFLSPDTKWNEKKNGTFSIHQNDVKVFLFFFHSVQQLFVDWAESVIGFVRMWDAQSDKDFGVGRLGTLTTRIVGSLALVKDHQEVRVLTSGPLLGRQLLVVLGRRS